MKREEENSILSFQVYFSINIEWVFNVLCSTKAAPYIFSNKYRIRFDRRHDIITMWRRRIRTRAFLLNKLITSYIILFILRFTWMRTFLRREFILLIYWQFWLIYWFNSGVLIWKKGASFRGFCSALLSMLRDENWFESIFDVFLISRFSILC